MDASAAATPPAEAGTMPAPRAGVVAKRIAWLRQHRWKLLAAIIASTLLAILALRWWTGPTVPAEIVVRRDFVQTVVASGHVETPHRIGIAAQITGTVRRVPVVEGQAVKAGQLLIEIDSLELRAASRQAALAVTQAEAGLRQLREVQAPVAEQALRQAQTALDNAQATETRNEALVAQGFISPAALDDSRKALELAEAQQRAAQKQRDAARPAGSDTALALANVAAAGAGAEAAAARAAYTEIRATVDGRLISRNVEAGDVVQPGTMLMALSPGENTQLVVAVDEKNLALLALGQPALASADAYPQQRFAANLVYINPGVTLLTGAVEIKLDVPQPPTTLTQDMTVSVDIEVARRRAALLVPTSTLHEADGTTPWVLVVDGRHALRRALKLGLQSGGTAEVLEGLSESDRVLAASAGVADGARVRVAAVPAPKP